MKNNELLELIKSLNQTEKRYFKIFASMSMKEKESSFISLFDALDKQKTYSEKEFLAKFKHKSFCKNYRFNKHYLFNLILKSMRLYHAKGNIQAQLADMKRDLDFLQKKNLYKSGLKLLSKAKKIAQKYEAHNDLVDLYKKEHVYSRYKNSPKKNLTYMNKLLAKELAAIKNMENIVRYEWLSDKTEAIAMAFGEVSGKKAKSEFKKIVKNPLLSDDKLATTTTSKMWYYLANTTYNFYTMNYQKAFENNQKAIDIVNRKRTLNYNTHLDFLKLLSRQIVISNLLKNYKAIEDGLKSAKLILNKHTNIPVLLQLEFALHELLYYTDTADFESALQLIKNIEGTISRPDSKLNVHNLQIIYYNLATVYFTTGFYKSALKFTNKILQLSKSDLRLDIRNSTTLLCIMIQYELGRKQYVGELTKTTKALFEKEDVLGIMENVALEMFSKISNVSFSKNETVELFSNYLKKLMKMRNVTSEKNKLHYLDIISWIESKIQGQTLSAIKKNKVMAH